jgi:O-Antigen ligase
MKFLGIKYTVLTWACTLSMIIFFLVPFQGIMTVWLASVVGHYTALRLWDEVLLAVCVILMIYLVLTDHKIRINTLSRRLVWTILAYIALTLAWGLISYKGHEVTRKALGYGLIVNLRYLVFFLITWGVALRMARLRANWQKFILWPAAVVVVFGLLQAFILPHDFLKHLGYGPNTIPITETINSNSSYIRVPSTLRGANPLGAYLIVPISFLTVLLLKGKRNLQQQLLLLGSVIVLFFTFSRSAWVGAALSVLVILAASKLSAKSQKLAVGIVGAVVVLSLVTVAVFHNNTRYQNFIFHTQTNSSVKTTSDQGHLADLRSGIKDVLHSPLGKGPGTAGPASVYNNNNPRIAEDYYVQIGQEVGWLGLILFLLINVGVGYLLWVRRDDPLALTLFASLIGISLANLLLYAWSDDTLAYLWWGLAGIAMAPDKTINVSKAVKKKAK